MNEKYIMNKLQEIFKDIFGDNSIIIEKSTNPNDIEGWDSITHISVLEAVQDEFKFKLTLDEMIELSSVGKIMDIITQKTPKK